VTMRHVLANLFTYVLAGLLVIGAIVFAWLRSSQILISNEATVLARFESAEPAVERRELGARSYAGNCQPCHGAEGRGWDQYPGLTRFGEIVTRPDGRSYAIALHLWGSNGDHFRAPMPPMGHMQDVELAAVIEHVLTHFGNRLPPDFPPITTDEIARHRAQPMHARDVARMRPSPERTARSP
jgi:mono/diheme cytochrome c family protein